MIRSPVRGAVAFASLLMMFALAGCSSDAPPPPPPPAQAALARDTATVWFHGASDSTMLLVEVADDEALRNEGLMNRTALDASSGMIFEWGMPQSAESGFWMFQTLIPIDIAFIGADDTVKKILSMEPCPAKFNPAACPTYAPGTEYSRAIEVNKGWFAEHGIAEGARVRVVR